MHGYEIHQRMSEAAGLGIVWHLKQSQLYALLARLEKRGYVAYTLEPQEPRPPRKVYALTPEGAAAFESWLRSPVERGRDFRLEFLAKVYFAQARNPAVRQALFTAQRSACRRWREELEAEREAQEQELFEHLVYTFRLGQIEAMLEWLDTSERILAQTEDYMEG